MGWRERQGRGGESGEGESLRMRDRFEYNGAIGYGGRFGRVKTTKCFGDVTTRKVEHPASTVYRGSFLRKTHLCELHALMPPAIDMDGDYCGVSLLGRS